MRLNSALALLAALAVSASAQTPPASSLSDEETLRHFQAIVRMNSTDPPGNEKPVVDYLKGVLEAEGIAVEIFSVEPNRPNLVARLRGSGKKKPLLMMGHSDTVNIDEKKWTQPPFSAARVDGHIYGRGTIDDKDNVTAGVMTLLSLKRRNVPLDRDVILLVEAGEEGTTRVGIKFITEQHFPKIDAEYCFAEGANVARASGQVKFAGVQTLEKIPRAIELTARGVSGHGSVPLRANAVVRLSTAVAKIGARKPEVRLNDTTRAYFTRLATVTSGEEAARYRAVVSGDPRAIDAADEWFLTNEPRTASTLRTSISPTILSGGYRVNVIPSEAKATLDVRTLPDEDPTKFLDVIRGVIGDPNVEVAYASRDVRPSFASTRLDSEAMMAIEGAVKRNYNTTTIPMMSTGATDMSYLRAKGMQCYGIGPGLDAEDGPKGFGAHSDQERILEAELYRFVRFQHDIVESLAKAR
jgi:acetylornithine deacetylase/succinyl-diaminopimelate desuccinylase-like protein